MLWRAPGFWTVISRSPASMAARMATLISRTERLAQSTAVTSGGPPLPSAALPAPHVPHGDRGGAGLARLVAAPEDGRERELLVRDRDGPVALADDQRLQTERVLREAERVGGAGQVAEAAVEVAQRRVEGLAQGQAVSQLAPEIDADHLGVVLGVEAHTLLLVEPSQAVVVR